MADRRVSLRLRLTAAATGVVTLVLAAGALGILVLFHHTLDEGLESNAAAQATTIAERIEANGVARLADEERDDDDRLLQVVDAGGEVIDANEPADEILALATAASDQTILVTLDGEDTYVVAAVQADIGELSLIVVVGLDREDANESFAALWPLVAIGVPLLALVLAAMIWFVTDAALQPIESAQRRQRRFVSDASHELKSPLASLRQYAEVATAYPDRLGAEELATAIRDEGGRLEGIVKGMLVLAHADEGTLHREANEVDLDDLLLVEAARLRASTDLTVSTSEVGAGRVRGQADLLGQVVRNLADNAARHAATRISFGLAEGGGRTRLTVDDDGAGVPEAERERVFERFVRLDDSRARDTGGSGLGLAIVRELVALHGGSTRVETSRLGGARFVVDLPASS